LGGLSDGLLPTPYTEMLEKKCHSLGWSLVQPIISSSYLGFGHGSLSRDTEEIAKLMWYLKCHRSAERFAFVGHSTGCQNAIHFLKHGNEDMLQLTKFIALQAPVSDREGPMQEIETYQKNIRIAKSLEGKGKGDEMMPRDAFWAPITAHRFLSLQDVGGEDDFFSSDFSDDKLVQVLGHVGRHQSNGLQVLVAFSGEDEYVPSTIDKKLLLERLCQAMNHKCTAEGTRPVAIPLMLKTGNHNLSSADGDAEMFVDEIAKYLQMVEL